MDQEPQKEKKNCVSSDNEEEQEHHEDNRSPATNDVQDEIELPSSQSNDLPFFLLLFKDTAGLHATMKPVDL